MRAINVKEQHSSSFYSSSCCPSLLTNSIQSCHLPIPFPSHSFHIQWMPLAMHFWFTLLFFLLFALLAFATPPLDAQRGTVTRESGKWYGQVCRGGGGAIWSAALTNFVRLHFAHGPETTSARRSLHGFFSASI